MYPQQCDYYNWELINPIPPFLFPSVWRHPSPFTSIYPQASRFVLPQKNRFSWTATEKSNQQSTDAPDLSCCVNLLIQSYQPTTTQSSWLLSRPTKNKKIVFGRNNRNSPLCLPCWVVFSYSDFSTHSTAWVVWWVAKSRNMKIVVNSSWKEQSIRSPRLLCRLYLQHSYQSSLQCPDFL